MNISIWTFWILTAFAITVLLFLYKKHEQMLSPDQKRERSRILGELNSFKYWQNWSFLLASTVLVAVNLFTAIELPIKYLFYLIVINLTYTIFRNRKVSQQIDLPDEYISKEFNLGILTVLLFGAAVFFLF